MKVVILAKTLKVASEGNYTDFDEVAAGGFVLICYYISYFTEEIGEPILEVFKSAVELRKENAVPDDVGCLVGASREVGLD